METTALTALRFGLDVTVKATLLLALALCLVAAFARASAALRHLAAMLGLAGALALPAASLFAPRVAVPVPASSSLLSADLSRLPTAALCAAKKALPGSAFGPMNASAPAAAAERTAWAPWALAIWAAGALLASVRLLLASLRIRSIARKSESLFDSEWQEEAADVARRFSVKPRVRILMNPEVPVAMTAGAFRPVLLVSSSARRWPADLRRVVLLHELAHVRRRDWITLLICDLAVGIYWFHPLAWLARREIRRNSERACDDMVIADGTKPSVYAAHLLGIVRSLASGARVARSATAMADRSQFEGRVRAILDPFLHRRGPSARQVRAAAVGLVASVLALGAIEPSVRRAAAAPAPVRVQPAVHATALAVSAAPVCAKSQHRPSPARPGAKRTCRKKGARSLAVRQGLPGPYTVSTDGPDALLS